MTSRRWCWVLVFLGAFSTASSQEPAGAVGGVVLDAAGLPVKDARVGALQKNTGVEKSTLTRFDGSFAFPRLPVGEYELRAQAPGFAEVLQGPYPIGIEDSVRVTLRLSLAENRQVVTVEAAAALVETESNVLGRTVGSREIVDLPLNGRNFTQLGLLQSGVVPLTAGLATAGGSLKSGQAFAVNGQRPESNNYLLDGSRIVSRMDGGYAFRVPVDAIAEFRILTHSAPAEYGMNSGSTTSVVMKSGANGLHSSLWYFLRNEVFDARSFFAEATEPLKQHQFGATLGGSIQKNKLFFFGFYEGFRNRQGITRSATVPTVEQRTGDFSQIKDPVTGQTVPLINFATGQPVPGNKLPPQALSPVALSVLNFYPLPNRGANVSVSTAMQQNRYNQGGGKLDYARNESDQWMVRYANSGGTNTNPLSIRGADVPGFPVRDNIFANSVAASETHLFSPRTVHTARFGWMGYNFLFDRRLNHQNPRELGFGYDPTLAAAQGPPYHIVQGYASVGNPITGPRDSSQNSYEGYSTLSMVRGAHNFKTGGEVRYTQVDAVQGIASNGFFVFSTFPFSDTFASFLTGRPVVFFQAGGGLQRGLRSNDFALYAQDEWRATRHFTLNYGLRYEVASPFREVRKRLNAFVPGRQSKVYPQAPQGVLFYGDDGVPGTIIPTYFGGIMPRTGFALDPAGHGKTSIRAAFAIFYDQVTNGTNQALTTPVSALPDTQAVQVSGPALNYSDPWRGNPPFGAPGFPRPSTVMAWSPDTKPSYAMNWNFSVQQSLWGRYLLEGRYVGTKGTRVPRYTEANPAIYGPGATAQNADARRLYAGCTPAGPPCALGTAGLITYSTNSTYHAAQLSLSRRWNNGVGFQASYWYSKLLDYVSSMSVAGSAPRLLSGENDLAQNPFNLAAEHGPSIFDARHRLTSSGAYALPWGFQLSGILTLYSGSAFTVYDGNNVSLQGQAPPISGFYSSRPDGLTDANNGPRTPGQWMLRSAFRRLDRVAEAGNFGNLGRNTVRGPGVANLDLSVLKRFRLSERHEVQFRVEGFNITNTPMFGLPVNDLVSSNFGRILDAYSARVFQGAIKFAF